MKSPNAKLNVIFDMRPVSSEHYLPVISYIVIGSVITIKRENNECFSQGFTYQHKSFFGALLRIEPPIVIGQQVNKDQRLVKITAQIIRNLKQNLAAAHRMITSPHEKILAVVEKEKTLICYCS